MGQIQKTIEIYEQLRKFKYHFEIENGISFDLNFFPEYYHHLAGFQHLTDKPHLSYQVEYTREFYAALKLGSITEEEILSSSKYGEMEKRVNSFAELLHIMTPENTKIIIDYDKDRVPSLIEAKFFIYKRDGEPFTESQVYYILFIGYDEEKKRYYPATFIVEDSSLFFRGATYLDCSITAIEKPKPKPKPKPDKKKQRR